MKKSPTKEEKMHMGKVAELGCIICSAPATIHHLRTGMGMGQRNSHFNTIGLCFNHHQGEQGIHTLGTKRWQQIYGNERDLLAKTKAMLGEK